MLLLATRRFLDIAVHDMTPPQTPGAYNQGLSNQLGGCRVDECNNFNHRALGTHANAIPRTILNLPLPHGLNLRKNPKLKLEKFLNQNKHMPYLGNTLLKSLTFTDRNDKKTN
ncbi:hypothetical protein AVEN_158071-1 [Araneus ventricosus]|uniref:Uncharacterized protein n=1 Tax=Araneus ventricosus TaxID=182803 RepID=A0A4Y2HUB0_ARAVE|nr:hypothetical protein AVEN_57073-1 [Araneus ventricosus]GBM69146.1 hypothetical protein AVEN_158071-1 [Araneus ventricosus]